MNFFFSCLPSMAEIGVVYRSLITERLRADTGALIDLEELFRLAGNFFVYTRKGFRTGRLGSSLLAYFEEDFTIDLDLCADY